MLQLGCASTVWYLQVCCQDLFKNLETLLVFSTHLYVFSASEATATWRFTIFVLYCIFCTVSS